jgi:signal transduction histidine kinase
MLESVERGAERMKRLIDDLLFLIKLDGGVLQDELRFGLREVDLVQAVKDVLNEMAPVAQEGKITLGVEAPAKLEITSMRVYIKDIVRRLVDNGIKFAHAGTGSVTVRVWEEGSYARIDVMDDGIGIHPDDQKVIFERFQQVAREELEQQGTGLGLSISREILELMGGEIWVTSAPGEGSTFSVSLPIEPDIS